MMYKNMKVSNQINLLLLGVIIIVFAIAIAGQLTMKSLWENTKAMYEHPLAVTQAISAAQVNVLTIRRDMLQLVIENDSQKQNELVSEIEKLKSETNRNLDVLYSQYLGPKEDIDQVSDNLAIWNNIRTETIRLVTEGKFEEAINMASREGTGGKQAQVVIDELTDIRIFAANKALDFFESSQKNRQNSVWINLSLLAGLLMIVILVGILFRRSILPPLEELSSAASAVQHGDLNIRVNSSSKNEFGKLAGAFNQMVSSLKRELDIKKNIAIISSEMLIHNSMSEFAEGILLKVMHLTQAEMGAIYKWDLPTGKYIPIFSLGLKNPGGESDSLERIGELDYTRKSSEIRLIKDIPAEGQYRFEAVSGEYPVREILTVPFVENKNERLILSIATITSFSDNSIRMIESVQSEISARAEALRASDKIVAISDDLKTANEELNQQKNELEMQSKELMIHNTELERQKAQLAEASLLKTTFLSNMSHELRTPLNAVIALSGVLNRKLNQKIPEEEYGYLEIIERNGKHLLDLINDILDISRIEAGKEYLVETTFDVNKTIESVVKRTQHLAAEKDLEVVHECSDSHLDINTDENKVVHILENLIGNAIKFTEAGKIKITAEMDEKYVTIRIKDTGIGIAEEHLPHIFDEFRQADGSISRKYGGTGLGLALSKKYIEILNGQISVRSIQNQGSTFTIQLPIGMKTATEKLENERRQEINIKVSSHLQSVDGVPELLLVEDNESAIIQMRELVQDMGYNVRIARGGQEALQRLMESIPQAIIMDLMMPGIDGFQLLEMIRNADITAHIPVLILTAKHITKEELRFLKRNNVHELIQKGGIDSSSLKVAIDRMLSSQEINQKNMNCKHQLTTNRRTVLVVDDNADNLYTAKVLLQEHYEILEASNAFDGIKIAEQKKPDLILMDISMIGTNGVEAYQKLRLNSSTATIPVVAATANALKEERLAIMAYGFDGFISKPFTEDALIQVLEEVLYAN